MRRWWTPTVALALVVASAGPVSAQPRASASPTAVDNRNVKVAAPSVAAEPAPVTPLRALGVPPIAPSAAAPGSQLPAASDLAPVQQPTSLADVTGDAGSSPLAVSSLGSLAVQSSSPSSALRELAPPTGRGNTATPANRGARARKPIPGRYILRVDRSYSLSERARAVSRAGGRVARELGSGVRMLIVEIDDASADTLRRLPGVTEVWQDEEVWLTDTQTNPPWGLDRIDQAALPLDSAFTYDTNGAAVNAYIIDSGIAATHTEFGGRVLTGADFSGVGVATTDCNSHGTHVAGTVGGATYGVAKAVTLIPVRVFGCSGSTAWSTVVSAINWMIADHDPGEPAVANMSLGGGAYSPIDDAVQAAVADGITMVVAAGNSSDNACNYSPARAPNAITVGAVGSDDTRAYFSNLGACVDVWAPGVGTVSADALNLPSGASTKSGTSMATPHVAGAVARLLSSNPALTPADVAVIVRGTAVSLAVGPLLQSPLYGTGTLPAAPTGLTAVPHKGYVNLSWDPAPPGVAGFRITLSTGGSIDVGRVSNTYTVSGLTNDVAVTFELKALNAFGWGPGISTTATPYDDGSPDPPTLRRVGSGDGWLALEVLVPPRPSGGAVTSLVARATPQAGGSIVTSTATVGPSDVRIVLRVDGLVNQASYAVEVAAVNAVGPSLNTPARVAMPGASIAVGSFYTSVGTSAGALRVPADVANAVTIDEKTGVVWASAGQSVVALDMANHFPTTGAITEDSARWLITDRSLGRTFSVPFYWGTQVKELALGDNAIVATNVATIPAATWATAYDQVRHELITAGTSVSRFGVSASGALTALPVPPLGLGSSSVTSVAIYGSKVVLTSFDGGWLKIWDRDTASVSTLTGLSYPGGLAVTSSGILVGAGRGSVITRVGWNATVLGRVDLRLPRLDGEPLYGYPYAFPQMVLFDDSTVLVSMSGSLVSMTTDTLSVIAMGQGFCCTAGGLTPNAIGKGPAGVYVASYWLTDARPDLTSSQMSFAQGDYTNAATGYVGGNEIAAVSVQYQNMMGLRIHERPSAARSVAVTAASGAARVTWEPPTYWGNGVSEAQRANIHERPFSYRVLVQPGNIEIPWSAGPLEVTLDGLDPAVTYTATVRVLSAAGMIDTAPVSFTPSTVTGVPAPPTSVVATPVRDGCVRVTWTASAGATSGYSVSAIGLSSSVSAAPGATSAELCGLHLTASQLPLVRARVVAIGASGSSIPSAPSAAVQATLAPVVDGYTVDTDVDPTLGVAVALTMTNTALNTQARRNILSVIDSTGTRSVPIPPSTNAILGFDPSDGVVYLGRCSVVPALFRVSLGTLQVTEVPLPAGGPADLCESIYDAERRVVWLSPTTRSTGNPFRLSGGFVQAMSVDGANPVVITTPLNCTRPEWTSGSIGYVGSPRFLIDGGRVYAKCISNLGWSYPMQLFRVVDAVTGAVVGESNSWLDIAGTTSSGDAVLVDQSKVSVVGATTRTIAFPASLQWSNYVLGMPFADGTNRFAKATKRVGNRVIAQSFNGPLYTVNLDDSTVFSSNGSFWPWFAGEGGTTFAAYTFNAVDVTNGTGTTAVPAETPPGRWEWVTSVGQRVTGLIQFDLPNPFDSVTTGDLGVFGNVRAPDNLGIATDESMMTMFTHLGPPSAPVSLSVSSDTVSWSAASTSGVLVDPGRYVRPVTTSSYEVRDGSDSVQCTVAVRTCTRAGAFGGGATVFGLQTLAAGTGFARSVATSSMPTYALTVSRSGSGAGTVSSSAGLLTCGSVCIDNFVSGSLVTLTAAPATGSTFTGWSGGCSGTSSTCTVSMTQARSVSANFDLLTFVLGVSSTGTGSGTVTAGSGAVNCGLTCSGTYNYGALVTLTATPATGSLFTGWSGACGGTSSTCTVSMTQARSVSANFDVLTFVLGVSSTGTGSGTVTAGSGAVNCGLTCSGTYNYGALVTLTATPATGSLFTGWSGACTGTSTCTVSMTQARSVTATFAIATFALTVSKSGSGTVTAGSGAVNCGLTCSGTYNYGALVTLTATPATGSLFTGWSGACTGTSTCTVSMTQARSVTATFVVGYVLSVSRAGTGSGTVTSSPTGVSCGSTCAVGYASGTRVVLTASASAGSRFTGWSGACTGTSTCTVTMSQARSVTATFQPLFTLSVSRTGTKLGTVSSNPTGISCGTTCSTAFVSGTSVTLTASAPSGGRFLGWSGACTGTSTKCTVSMSQARSVTAAFS